MYIHQLKNWPHFKWDNSNLTSLLAEVRHLQGSLLGKMSGLGFKLQNETSLKTLTEDVIKSSEIEGELLNEEQVRSSIAKKMGIDIGIVQEADRHIDGIVEIMFDATKNYYDSLTKNRLFAWHAALFPTGRSGMSEITVGSWRKKDSGIMQVVSGPIGKETVHFEAPTYDKLNKEMQHFIKWFNSTTKDDLVLKSSIAHLWFVTIHPFADGNGRLVRLIANLPLLKAGLAPLLIDQSKRREYITLLADYQSAIPAPKLEKGSKHSFWPQPAMLEPFSDFCANNYRTTAEVLK